VRAFFDGVLCPFNREMSERKQVRAATSQLASIVESADDAIIGMTLDGIILSWNQSAERIFGYSAEEVKGRPISILIPSERSDEVPRILERVKRGERVEHYETVRRGKDGTLIDVSMTISPTRAETGKIAGASTIASDDTERKRAQQLLIQRTTELEAANKELEAFTYSVSHDLRAPLRHIDGFSKILLEDFGPQMNTAAKEYLQRIHETAQYMGRLVDDLLHLARVGRQELILQITGLDALVEEAIVHLRTEVQDRQIDWQVGPLPFVECDPGLIKQVFANLLSNALKFTRPRERAVIEVGQMTVDGQPVIFVRDNGIGFDMRYADKMFGVFQRLHRQEDFEGTGVGLAIVERIIHKHAGRVWAEAEVEKGATFYFTLVPPGQARMETMSMIGGKACRQTK
jgi:PAS domain S-box-containing protein